MIRGSIQRPIAISMLFLALVLIGLLSYNRLPVDLLPAINYPRLTVITLYEDVPAQELERLVTQPIEEVVTALSGVRSVLTRTRKGISALTVEYEWGTQMDFANLHLREAVDRVSFRDDFPEDAERPLILRWDPTARPVSVLVLEGQGRFEQLSEFAEEVVKPALEQVDGLSQAEVVGATEREILVRPDFDKLALYGIELEDIRSALARSNITFPGGRVRQGSRHLSLRIAGEFESIEDIGSTDIVRAGGNTVRVSDVAEVLESTKEPEGFTLLGDSQVVSVLIYKEPEANTLQVAEEVDIALGVLADSYPDFGYHFVTRDADYVRASFQGLMQSLLWGAILAFLILFLFLSDFRSPFVVGLSIPVSILITFALLYFGKVKLNLMSLGGLSLAVGMLVDNAIVVLENIRRHVDIELTEDDLKAVTSEDDRESRRLNVRRKVALAAERGAGEMARPVIAATLTTVAVFFPVVYVPGIAGAFFRDQALTVTFSLLLSIAAALLLQPMLTVRIFTAPLRLIWILFAAIIPPMRRWLDDEFAHLRGQPRGLFRLFQMGLDRFHGRYHRVLVKALAHPVLMIVLLLIGLGAGGFLASRLDRSFLPESSSGNMRLDLELTAGTSLDETRALSGQLAEWLEADEAVYAAFSQIGTTEKTLAALNEYTASNTTRMTIILEKDRNNPREAQRIQGAVADRLKDLHDISFSFREEGVGLREVLGGDGAPFSLGVVAEDPQLAAEVADDIMNLIERVPGLVDLKVDRVLDSPNLVASLNREEILRQRLNSELISRELRDRVTGVAATTFNEIDQRIDIAVRLSRDERRDLNRTLSAPIELPAGGSAPLGSFLTIDQERPVRELLRRNQRRMVTLSGELQERGLDDVWEEVLLLSESYPLPEGVELIQTGEQEAMRKSFRDLGWALILAVLLVYMILAAQFESFLDPLLIAAVIPIGIAGSALAIWITGNSINTLSLIGVVALLGISVNDAIVKVDTIRRLRADGMPGHAAIFEASRLRLRPILMTSCTTILAMLPMAIGLGSGEQMQRPLAITIIGGLALTTTLTLFYTPVLYQMAHRLRPERESSS